MLYHFDDLSDLSKARAIDDLWDEYSTDPDFTSWFVSVAWPHFASLYDYFQNLNGSAFFFDHDLDLSIPGWPLPGTFAYVPDSRGGWSFIEETATFTATVDLDRWVDPSSLSAARSNVPLADIEWFFLWPDPVEMPYDGYIAPMDYADDLEFWDHDLNEAVFELDDDPEAFWDLLDFTFRTAVISAAEHFFWDRCYDILMNDIVPRLEDELAALGPVFADDGSMPGR